MIVVEHDEDTLRLADELIELGPEAGVEGGRLLFQGTPADCAKLSAKESRTGPYLAGRLRVLKDAKTKDPGEAWLNVREAREQHIVKWQLRRGSAGADIAQGPLQSGKGARLWGARSLRNPRVSY